MTATCGPSRGARDACPAGTGMGVRLRADVERLHGGEYLMSSTSGTVLRLLPAARALLDGRDDVPVTDRRSGRLARVLLDRGLAEPRWDPPTSDLHDVAVVVPVRDRDAALTRLLAGLPRDLAEVVVVDDGGSDGAATRRVVERAGGRYLRHERSLGPAAARNTGLAHVGADVVAFLDSDVALDGGALEHLRRELDDPAVAAVGPRVLALEVGGGSLVSRYEACRSALDLGDDPGRVAPGTRLSYLPSAALLVRRAALGAGFDAGLHVAEDVDLVWRLHRDGWRVRYLPSATVRHDHRTGLGPWWSRRVFYGTGAALLAQRHGRLVAPLHLDPVSALVLAALLVRGRVGAAAGAAAVATQLVALHATARRGPGGHDPARAPEQRRLTLRFTRMSLAGATRQTLTAVNRHYWPLLAAVALVSRRTRRTLVAAALVDAVAARRGCPDVPWPARVALSRLDDLAYGTGLWLGAAHVRSVAALVPRWSVPAHLRRPVAHPDIHPA